MCLNCLVEARPARGTCTLDDGAFVLNFRSCNSCGRRDQPRATRREETISSEDDTEIEEIEYQHVCPCGHVISNHYYRESAGENFVRYLMDCSLCGYGAHEKVPYLRQVI